jgi:xylulokinase
MLMVDIEAISFSTQTPTLVFCDSQLQPVCPAIIWQDARAGAEAELLRTGYPDARRREWFGMDLPVAAASTPAKLLWMATHSADAWRRTRWVMQPKDYVAAALTTEPATDGWCAKGLAHVDTGAVASEFMSLLGKAESPCPRVLAATDIAGVVTRDAAAEWGVASGLPVMVGWSDALTGILSTGACHITQRGFVITGTSEIVGMSRSDGIRHPGLFGVPRHLLPDTGLELHFGPTQAGGSAVDWLARIVGKCTPDLLELLPADLRPSPILFRPHLAGERAPYWNHSLTASFDGLRLEHGVAELVLAVVQGIALQEQLVLSCAEQETPANEIVLAGGGARHKRWNQLRANVLQRPVEAMRDVEASLRGAALIAWAGVGALYLQQPPDVWFNSDRLDPSPSWASASRELAERFVLPGFQLWSAGQA